MTMDKRTKRYIYLRDEGKCHHCGKSVDFDKVNIDHYYPRSKGGTDDYFNLVLSCKRCNKYKGCMVPKDIDQVNLLLMIRAIQDEQVSVGVKGLKPSELLEMAQQSVTIERVDAKQTRFEGTRGKFVIKENCVVRIER